MANPIKLSEAKHFLGILFNPGETIWCATRPANRYKSISQEFALSFVGKDSKDGIFCSYSPASAFGLPRRLGNMGRCRNLLVEFDRITLEEQKALVADLKLPHSTAVFSGNKSVHYIISLEDAVDYETYCEFAKLLIDRIPGMDRANNRGVSYCRLPNGLRNGVEQSLIHCGERIKNSEFHEYINSLPAIVQTPSDSPGLTLVAPSVSEWFSGSHNLNRERLLSWYAFHYLRSRPTPNRFSLKILCPVCAEQEHDTSRDNLSVNIKKHFLFHCFAGGTPEHDRLIMPTIKRLMESRWYQNE